VIPDECARIDPNPILDTGAPHSIGGISAAAQLANALGHQLLLDAPTEQVSQISWGPTAVSPQQIFATWNIQVPDIHGVLARFCFHLTQSETPLLLGHDVLKHCTLHLNENPSWLEIQQHSTRTRFLTYTQGFRTRIEIAPIYNSCIKSSRIRSSLFAVTSQSKEAQSPGTVTQEPSVTLAASQLTPCALASRLHSYSHASLRDLRRLLSRANMLSSDREHALRQVVQNCEICVQIGRPAPSRKVSPIRIVAEFNQTVQVDFMFITLRNSPLTLFHIVDSATAYSTAQIVPSRDLYHAAYVFESQWISAHGAPSSLAADPEFARTGFKHLLASHHILFAERPARRHQKTGCVERKNGVLRPILHRLALADSSSPLSVIVARGILCSNALLGNRICSSFELARGYSPAFGSLPQSVLHPGLVDAYHERTAARAIHRMLTAKNPYILHHLLLPPGTPVWTYLKDKKWHRCLVAEAKQNFVTVRRHAKGPAMALAYEDLRLAPRSDVSIVAEAASLDAPELALPDSSSFGDEGDHVDIVSDTPTFLSSVDRQEEEQRLLQLMLQRVGHKQISLAHATAITAPWLVDASFTRELSNWKDAYELIPLDRLPPDANYIRSHAFCHIKRATDDDLDSSLRLKTRIVLHGNEDKEKDDLRKDTQAASFTSIRTLLALAAIYNLHIASIDIKGAYLQSGRCRRDIFVRPPNEWRQVRGVAWKLLKLPYGLPDAGHQWQVVIDDFILSLGFSVIPGLPQLFMHRSDPKNPPTVLAKVTDDILIVGTPSALASFIQNIRASFDVGRLQYHTNMTFNGAFISVAQLGFTLDITEPLSRLSPIALDLARRSTPLEAITPEELTALRSLAGSLNYIGQAACPPATFVASAIQQLIGRTANVSILLQANAMLKELQRLPSVIHFPLADARDSFRVVAMSDASFAPSSRYGQTGIILWLQPFRERTPEAAIRSASPSYLLEWSSVKQRRIANSSLGAEILAASLADDVLVGFAQSLASVLAPHVVATLLLLDSRSLYQLVSSFKQSGMDARLAAVVDRLRDSFMSAELGELGWIPGSAQLADSLTKRNPTGWRSLMAAAGSAELDIPRCACFRGSSWRHTVSGGDA
jgi:hypothetical protein